jgi:hypothetical protein
MDCERIGVMSQPLEFIFLMPIVNWMMSVGSTGDNIPSFEITTEREPWHHSAQKRGVSQLRLMLPAISQVMNIINDDSRLRFVALARGPFPVPPGCSFWPARAPRLSSRLRDALRILGTGRRSRIVFRNVIAQDAYLTVLLMLLIWLTLPGWVWLFPS